MRKIFLLIVFACTFFTCLMATETIELWFHSGRGAERDVITDQVKRFNEMQDLVEIKAVQLPEGSYNDQVQAAALAGKLPDILDLDGPNMTNYAWGEFIIPLDKFIPEDMKMDFLPSILKQGTYNGNIYALGTFDSGLAIWGNKKYLEKIGARIPTSVEDAWTMDEFMDILKKLKALDEVTYPLDLKLNYGLGEWYTYGFSPIFQAFGADLIDRTDYMSADGVLNSPEGVAAGKWFGELFENGYANPNPPGDADFMEGKNALSWVGHWVYKQYTEALGDDLVLLPMPKLGDPNGMYKGQATGTGSWCWGITSSCDNPYGAWLFLQFILRPEEIVKMTDANGAVPARMSATKLSKPYAPDGDLRLFVEQLETIGVERPVTPAYPIITSEFTRALDDIINGVDVKDALDYAVEEIDLDIEDNDGYPM